MNFNVDTPPTIVPRPEKSSVRADMNKALETMRARRANQALRQESGAAVTEAEKSAYGAMSSKDAAQKSKGAKRFDAAVQHPVLKNLGL